MVTLQQIESDLTAAMKARNRLAAEVLRGLKTRITNERIAKQKDLTDDDLLGLIRSEIKKRKESADAFKTGGRTEMAEKELKETSILQKYLPAQMPEADLLKIIDEIIAQNNFTAQDFGKAMSTLKAKTGIAADGATLSRLLKEKLQI